jgi:2-keto-3-deoxy-L-rhamnonate aldolase RhmA
MFTKTKAYKRSFDVRRLLQWTIQKNSLSLSERKIVNFYIGLWERQKARQQFLERNLFITKGVNKLEEGKMHYKFLDKIREKKVSIGTLEVLDSPEVVETLAFAGMDFIKIEMMFSSTDWNRAAHMIRAAKGAGIAPLIRLPCNPWVTKGEDQHLAVDVTRAFGIDAMGVVFSPDTQKEVEKALEVGRDYHHSIHICRFADRFADAQAKFGTFEKEVAGETLIMPLIESEGAVRNIADILSVEGLKTALLGFSDLSVMLGHPFQYEHPEVWRLCDKAANIAEKHGVILGGNTGYHVQTPEDIGKRIKRMYDHGIRIFVCHTTGSLLQIFIRDIIRSATAELGGKTAKG